MIADTDGKGSTENLTVHGFFLKTDRLAPLGAAVELTLDLPDDEGPVEADGRVVRIARRQDEAMGFAVEFEQLEGSVRQRIAVLVEHARRRNADKRGGGWERTTLNDGDNAVDFSPDEILALDRALSELEPRQREVVEYRFFGGMEEQEVAAVMGVSDRTVRRDWVKARAWLYKSLYQEPEA